MTAATPPSIPNVTREVDTLRDGPWRFCVGVDPAALAVPLIRVDDAHARLAASPLSQVANELEKEVLVSSVWGTNTIEGGDVSEEETARIIEQDPQSIKEQAAKRVANLKQAYDFAVTQAQDPLWRPDFDFIVRLHQLITNELVHEHNQPGVLRDTPKSLRTRVGDPDHGGIYKPPQSGRDIEYLLKTMLAWDNDMVAQGVPPLVRAPLLHYYFERIHPFWDGNGRAGRVLELAVLRNAGYRYAPFALPRYYLNHIDRYFSLFNLCRKDKSEYPNTGFVAFFLEAMLEVTNRLHDRVNTMVGQVLFLARLKLLRDDKTLNSRQYAVMNMLCSGRYRDYRQLRNDPTFQELYRKVTAKTRQRDWNGLVELGLVKETADGQLRLDL